MSDEQETSAREVALANLRRVAAAVLIPIKSFDLAKGRLGEALTRGQRSELARRMAATVISAANGLSTYVVCGDHAVADFAGSHGSTVIWREPNGLNAAITDGVTILGDEGFETVIVAHADLPLATDLSWLATEETARGVVLVPDRRNDGSNVMALPTRTGFRFLYGPGSAAAHEAEAARLDLPFRLAPHAELGWDIDVPDDLSVFDPSFQLDSTGIRGLAGGAEIQPTPTTGEVAP